MIATVTISSSLRAKDSNTDSQISLPQYNVVVPARPGVRSTFEHEGQHRHKHTCTCNYKLTHRRIRQHTRAHMHMITIAHIQTRAPLIVQAIDYMQSLCCDRSSMLWNVEATYMCMYRTFDSVPKCAHAAAICFSRLPRLRGTGRCIFSLDRACICITTLPTNSRYFALYLPYTLMMHRMHDLLLMTPTLLAHRSHMLGPCCQTSDRNSIIPWKHAVSNIQHRWCDRHIDSNPCLECTHDVGNVQHVCKLQGSYGCSGNIAGATRTCST